MPFTSRKQASFTVETRHPTRKRTPIRITALGGPSRAPDFAPVSDEIPERDVRADLSDTPSGPKIRSPLSPPPVVGTLSQDDRTRPPVSRWVEKAFRTSQEPDAPQVQDDSVTTIETSAKAPTKPTGRILPSLLDPIDPVQQRLDEAANARSMRRHGVTALASTTAAPAARRKRVIVALTKTPDQHDLPLVPANSDAEMPWPDDAVIEARRIDAAPDDEKAARIPSIASQEVAEIASKRRHPNGTHGAIDVTPRPEIEAAYEVAQNRSTRSFHFNRAIMQRERSAARRYTAEEAAPVLPRGEKWKRRIPTALWGR